jgi:hypothetical protein
LFSPHRLLRQLSVPPEGVPQLITTPTKQELIEYYLTTSVKTGERVYFVKDSGKLVQGTISHIDGDEVVVQCDYYSQYTVKISDIKRSTRHIGAHPFHKQHDIRSYNFSIEQILSSINLLPGYNKTDYEIEGVPISEINFDPYVIIDGEKRYFQRPLVWSLEDKQCLIDSIYNSISCGALLFRKYTWDEVEGIAKTGETVLSFADIIDGKQRLNALADFVNNKFPDSFGNYFDDLSDSAQFTFFNSTAFSYNQISNATDKQILEEFLKVNFSGVPQSKQHIDFVTELYKSI